MKKRYKLAIAAVVIIILFSVLSPKKGNPVSFIEFGDYSDTITLSGKVVSSQDVEISFETSGTVKSIDKNSGDFVKKGDTIIRLDAEKEFSLYKEQQTKIQNLQLSLDSVVNGSGLIKTKSSLDTLNNYRLNVISKIEKIKAEIITSIATTLDDEWFSLIRTGVYSIKGVSGLHGVISSVNESRGLVDSHFQRWENETLEIDSEYAVVEEELKILEKEISDIRVLISKLSVLSSKASASQKQVFISTQRNVNESIDEFIALKTEINNLYNSYLLQLSERKLQIEDIKLQIVAEKNVLNNFLVSFNKRSIKAPFDGVVGSVDVNVGDSVSAGDKIVRVLGKSDFQLVSEVSEFNQSALIQSGEENYNAYIEAIDETVPVSISRVVPAERTVGLSSIYTIEFSINKELTNLRSGMSADIKVVRNEFKEKFAVDAIAIKKIDEKDHIVYADDQNDPVPVTVLGYVSGKAILEGEFEKEKAVIINLKR